MSVEIKRTKQRREQKKPKTKGVVSNLIARGKKPSGKKVPPDYTRQVSVVHHIQYILVIKASALA